MKKLKLFEACRGNIYSIHKMLFNENYSELMGKYWIDKKVLIFCVYSIFGIYTKKYVSQARLHSENNSGYSQLNVDAIIYVWLGMKRQLLWECCTYDVYRSGKVTKQITGGSSWEVVCVSVFRVKMASIIQHIYI